MQRTIAAGLLPGRVVMLRRACACTPFRTFTDLVCKKSGGRDRSVVEAGRVGVGLGAVGRRTGRAVGDRERRSRPRRESVDRHPGRTGTASRRKALTTAYRPNGGVGTTVLPNGRPSPVGRPSTTGMRARRCTSPGLGVWSRRPAGLRARCGIYGRKRHASAANPSPHPSGANTPHQSSKPAAARPCLTAYGARRRRSTHLLRRVRAWLVRGAAPVCRRALGQRAWPNCRTSVAPAAGPTAPLAKRRRLGKRGGNHSPHATPALGPATRFHAAPRGPVSNKSLRRCANQVHQEMKRRAAPATMVWRAGEA
jgi:hypothetical protein